MAEQIGSLAYKLTVDNGQFSTGMAQAGAQIDQLAQKSGQSSATIERAFAGAQSSASSFAGGVSGSVSQVASQFAGLGSSIAAFATGPIGIAVIAIGSLVTALDKIEGAARNAVKQISDVGKFAKAFGESNEGVQVLQRVFKGAGFSEDDTQQVLQKFLSKIGELREGLASGKGSPVEDALKRIGLDPGAISKLGVEQALEQITRGLNQFGNRADSTRAANEIFGKSYLQLFDIIRRGSGAFDEARRNVAATGFSDADVEQAEKQKANIRRAQQNRDILSGAWDRAWARTFAGTGFETGLMDGLVNWFVERHIAPPTSDAARGNRGPDQAVQFDVVADAIKKADVQASELLSTYEKQRDALSSLTEAQKELAELEYYGLVTEARADQIRSLEREIGLLEHRKQIEHEMRGLLNSNRTALEKFADLQFKITQSSIDQSDASRLLGSAFRDIERSIGSGPGSFAIRGASAGSVEAANIIADFQVRGRLQEGGVQDRILNVLGLANEIAERNERELRSIGDALRGAPAVAEFPE
jgi:hypothetical protein